VAGQQATALKTITDAYGQDLRQVCPGAIDGCSSSWSSSSSLSPSLPPSLPSHPVSIAAHVSWCRSEREVDWEETHSLVSGARPCALALLSAPSASHTPCCVALLLGHSRHLGRELRGHLPGLAAVWREIAADYIGR
jgi:hypothetical protein